LLLFEIDFEVSISNIMQAVSGVLVAVSCFGAAYLAHMLFPVQPIGDADLLLTQSTLGTVNVLDKESIQQRAKTPREMIKLYIGRSANLGDILELLTGELTVEDAYKALREKQDPTPEEKYLIRAAEQNYGFKPPVSTPSPVVNTPSPVVDTPSPVVSTPSTPASSSPTVLPSGENPSVAQLETPKTDSQP
jgi:hypothetical protein